MPSLQPSKEHKKAFWPLKIFHFHIREKEANAALNETAKFKILLAIHLSNKIPERKERTKKMDLLYKWYIGQAIHSKAQRGKR